MLRTAFRLAVLVCLVATGSAGVWWYNHRDPLAARVLQLEEEKRVLKDVVRRLTEERRAAEMIVTDQQVDAAGDVTATTVLFVEQARDGSPLPAKSFTIKGGEAYVDGLSVRFHDDFVSGVRNDPLRGHGLVLFTRIFGEHQTPAQGTPIDTPGQIPDVYRGDPREVARVSQFERDLWADFWRLVDDKEFRATKGVELASGKAVHLPLKPDRLYRITVDARGNPSMDWEPVKPIYREALRQQQQQGAPARPPVQ